MSITNNTLFAAEKDRCIVRTPFEFDLAQTKAKNALSAELARKATTHTFQNRSERTGWLPGPLSYPWIFIAIGISDLVHSYLAL